MQIKTKKIRYLLTPLKMAINKKLREKPVFGQRKGNPCEWSAPVESYMEFL